MGVSDSNFDECESHLRVLADQLFFKVEKNGDRFTLKRTADVSEPVCESNLGLDEAEELLRAARSRWVMVAQSPTIIRVDLRQILFETAQRSPGRQSTIE